MYHPVTKVELISYLPLLLWPSSSGQTHHRFTTFEIFKLSDTNRVTVLHRLVSKDQQVSVGDPLKDPQNLCRSLQLHSYITQR